MEKILSNPSKPTYSIPELEFEFDLKWNDLKKLLDKHYEYTQDGESVVINRLKPKKIRKSDIDSENHVKDEDLEELENFFYRRHKHGEQIYGRVRLKKKALEVMNPKLREALFLGEKSGLVIVTKNPIDNTITFQLHHYYRPRSHS